MGRIRINRPVRKPLVRFANGTKYCEPVSPVRELEGSLMGRNMYTMTWCREKAKHLKYVIKIELSLINHETLVVSCTGRKFC